MNAPNPSDTGFTVTMGGKTYRFDGEIARVVKRHRERYADERQGAAFYHGFLTCMAVLSAMTKGASERGKAEEHQT